MQVVRPVIHAQILRLHRLFPLAAVARIDHSLRHQHAIQFLMAQTQLILHHDQIDHAVQVRQHRRGQLLHRDLAIHIRGTHPVTCGVHLRIILVQAMHQGAAVLLQRCRQLAIANAKVHHEATDHTRLLQDGFGIIIRPSQDRQGKQNKSSNEVSGHGPVETQPTRRPLS